MVRSAYLPPRGSVTRPVPTWVRDPGVSAAQGGTNEVGMPGNALAHFVELLVAARIVAATLKDKPPVGNGVTQLRRSPVREPGHQAWVRDGIAADRREPREPPALPQVVGAPRVIPERVAARP